MTRITSTIVIFLVLMNGTVGIMSVSGLTEDVGVDLAPGMSDKINSLVDEMKNGFNPSTTIVESVISFILAGINIFSIVVEGLFLAPTVFINLFSGGIVVETMVFALFAPAYLIATLEFVYLATGNDMV